MLTLLFAQDALAEDTHSDSVAFVASIKHLQESFHAEQLNPVQLDALFYYAKRVFHLNAYILALHQRPKTTPLYLGYILAGIANWYEARVIWKSLLFSPYQTGRVVPTTRGNCVLELDQLGQKVFDPHASHQYSFSQAAGKRCCPLVPWLR